MRLLILSLKRCESDHKQYNATTVQLLNRDRGLKF